MGGSPTASTWRPVCTIPYFHFHHSFRKYSTSKHQNFLINSRFSSSFLKDQLMQKAKIVADVYTDYIIVTGLLLEVKPGSKLIYGMEGGVGKSGG